MLQLVCRYIDCDKNYITRPILEPEYMLIKNIYCTFKKLPAAFLCLTFYACKCDGMNISFHKLFYKWHYSLLFPYVIMRIVKILICQHFIYLCKTPAKCFYISFPLIKPYRRPSYNKCIYNSYQNKRHKNNYDKCFHLYFDSQICIVI